MAAALALWEMRMASSSMILRRHSLGLVTVIQQQSLIALGYHLEWLMFLFLSSSLTQPLLFTCSITPAASQGLPLRCLLPACRPSLTVGARDAAFYPALGHSDCCFAGCWSWFITSVPASSTYISFLLLHKINEYFCCKEECHWNVCELTRGLNASLRVLGQGEERHSHSS